MLRYQLILTHSTLIFLILFLFWFAFINSEKLRFMMKVCFFTLAIVFFTLFSFCNDDQVLIGNDFQNKLYQYICDHDWYQDFGYYSGFWIFASIHFSWDRTCTYSIWSSEFESIISCSNSFSQCFHTSHIIFHCFEFYLKVRFSFHQFICLDNR